MPDNFSANGAGIDELIIYVHLLMGVLFAGWFAYFLYAIFRFSKSRNPKADHAGVTSHASTWLEGIVAVVEAVLLIGFALPLWAKAVEKFPDAKDSTVIKLTAQQFAWNARYAGADGKFGANDIKLVSTENKFGLDKKDPAAKDDFMVINDLVVPVNKPVLVEITSLDVIHCFAVKPMRVTQDAIPGIMIPAWFHPVKEGTYNINCAQLCGNSHYAMRGNLKVVSQAEFDKWVAEKSKSSAPASYE